MKTITKTINLYKFSELTEESQQKAINNLYDININYDWWTCTYEDAENIGVKICSFDLDRGTSVEIKLFEDAKKVAQNVIAEYGKSAELYTICSELLKDLKTIKIIEDEDERYTKNEELQEEFINNLESYYLKGLRSEYEYLISEEAIRESIEINEYDFTEDGELYS